MPRHSTLADLFHQSTKSTTRSATAHKDSSSCWAVARSFPFTFISLLLFTLLLTTLPLLSRRTGRAFRKQRVLKFNATLLSTKDYRLSCHMSIADSGPQGHSDHRIQLLKDIGKFQTNKNAGTLTSDALHSLLTNMTSYLEYDQNQDDFGDIDDEDLMMAETADAIGSHSSQNLKRSFDFEDESPSKKFKTENGSTSIALARKILKDTWGFSEFKHKQEQAITRLIDGGSAVVVFPTGGGKSLVFQIPALAFDYHDELNCGPRGGGVTLVVSPLIALMKVRKSSNTFIQTWIVLLASQSESQKLMTSSRIK